MRKSLPFIAVIFVFGFMLCVGIRLEFNRPTADEPIDPRAPPAGIDPGRYSHQTTETETWNKIPMSSKQTGGTEAASFERQSSTTDRTDNTDELFDYGSLLAREPALGRMSSTRSHATDSIPRTCDGSCQGSAPVPIYPPSERSGPPAPAYIGERAPYWYEKEGQYREPDWPGPGDEAERKGLFARLRERRAGR